LYLNTNIQFSQDTSPPAKRLKKNEQDSDVLYEPSTVTDDTLYSLPPEKVPTKSTPCKKREIASLPRQLGWASTGKQTVQVSE